MRKILALSSCFLFMSLMILSQPTRYVQPRQDSCKFSPSNAARMWFAEWETARPETTVYVYIRQGFTFKAPLWQDSSGCYRDVDYHFTLDSITGRGDKRKALLSVAWKTPDSADWVWTVRRMGEWVPDSLFGGHRSATAYLDTLGITTDSTRKQGQWITYMRRFFDPTFNKWYTYADAAEPPVDIWMQWPCGQYRWRLRLRMEKILGDPLENFGWNQRAVLKMALYQMPSDSLYRASVGE